MRSRLSILVLPLLLGSCSDLFVSDARPVAGPEGPGVAVVLRWGSGGGGLDVSRVPLLARVRLVVDYPENHAASRSGGGAALGLEDVDLPLDGSELEVDVAAGDGRVFRVAAYQAGRTLPVYYGEARADIDEDDGTSDPQVVMIDMAEIPEELELVPLVAIATDLETLAGNTVLVEAGAADFELAEVSLEWTVTLGGEAQELGVPDDDEGALAMRPLAVGSYRVEVAAEAGEKTAEPAYAWVDVVYCDEAPEGLECDDGLTCAADGVCRGADDELPADDESSDAEADGG